MVQVSTKNPATRSHFQGQQACRRQTLLWFSCYHMWLKTLESLLGNISTSQREVNTNTILVEVASSSCMLKLICSAKVLYGEAGGFGASKVRLLSGVAIFQVIAAAYSVLCHPSIFPHHRWSPGWRWWEHFLPDFGSPLSKLIYHWVKCYISIIHLLVRIMWRWIKVAGGRRNGEIGEEEEGNSCWGGRKGERSRREVLWVLNI